MAFFLAFGVTAERLQEVRDEQIRHHHARSGICFVFCERRIWHFADDRFAQRSRDDANGTMLNGKDPIGLTATQRQMIAWSIAGIAEMQPVPPHFQPQPGMKPPAK